jgi:hypothetical protein
LRRSQWKPARSERSRVASGALQLDLVDVDDVLGPRRGVADGERLDLGLDVPRVVVPARHPRPPDPDRARAGEPPDLRRVSGAEDEIVEAVRPRDERVLVVVGPVDHAVAGPDLMHLAVLPRQP